MCMEGGAIGFSQRSFGCRLPNRRTPAESAGADTEAPGVWVPSGKSHEGGAPAGFSHDADRLRSFALWRVSSVESTARLRREAGRVDALVRLREAQAQAVEQQVARMQAELVPAHEVAEMLERWVVGFRARLLAVVDRLAGRFTAQQLDSGRRELLSTLD